MFLIPGSRMMPVYLGGLFSSSRGILQVEETGRVILEIRKPKMMSYEHSLALFRKLQMAVTAGRPVGTVYPDIETVSGLGLFVANDDDAIAIMRLIQGDSVFPSKDAKIKKILKWWDAGRAYGAPLEALIKEVNNPDNPAVLQSRLDGDESCATCGVKSGNGKSLKRCGGCKIPVYCCKKCQQQDWRSHKKLCRATRQHLNIYGK